MSRRSSRISSRVPSDVSSVARRKWSEEHDTKHAKLTRNYAGDDTVFHELRHPDFDEHAQHDANELRAATHHNYNEVQLADEATRTHLHTSHHRQTRAGRSEGQEPEPIASAPAPAGTEEQPRKSRHRNSPRSPSPAPSQFAAASGLEEKQETGGSILDMLPWVYIGGCALIGGTWLRSVASALA